MSHRVPTNSRHIIERMKLLVSSRVRSEPRWLKPLLATEIEYGDLGQPGPRPAFTTMAELKPKYRAHIGSLRPGQLPWRTISKNRANSMIDVQQRPHTQIVFPEDVARSAYLQALTGQDSGMQSADIGGARPAANLVDSQPFEESERFVRDVEARGSAVDDEFGLAAAITELKASLQSRAEEVAAAEQTRRLSQHDAGETGTSLDHLFSMMGSIRQEQQRRSSASAATNGASIDQTKPSPDDSNGESSK